MSAVGGSCASTDSRTLPSPRPPSRLAPKRSSQYSLSYERNGIRAMRRREGRSVVIAVTCDSRWQHGHPKDELLRSTCRGERARTFHPKYLTLSLPASCSCPAI